MERVIWPNFSVPGDGLGYKPPECWDTWGAGVLDQQVQAQGYQSCHKCLPKGHTILLHGDIKWIAQHYGAKGEFTPQKPYISEAVAPSAPSVEREWQNEDTVVNHLRTVHYHLSLVCALCLDFFSTSVDAMKQHIHVCKSIATKNNDHEEEESENDNNSDEDDDYLLEEA